MAVTDELIELNGLRFHYRDWASTTAGAPTLLFLHGFTGHSRIWDPAAQELTRTHRILALDQRGHGESAWGPPEGYTPQQLGDDLAAFVAALDLRNFTLVGLSMGGTASIEYAGRRPSELARLVIVDVTPEIAQAGRDRIAAGLEASDVFETRDVVIERMVAANPNGDPEAIARRARHNLMRTADGRWTWRWDRALRRRAVVEQTTFQPPETGWERCAAVTVPTLLIRGERSDIVSVEAGRQMVHVIPDCRFIEVAGSGHTVPYDRFEGFMEALRTFV